MDVTTVVPEVSGDTTIAVRLHPQQGEVADLGASKVGGQILWPENEPWPTCSHAEHLDDQRPVLVPILQLKKEDVPELPFPPKKNLFQLLWCPNRCEHDGLFNPLPRIFWRNSERVSKPIETARKGMRWSFCCSLETVSTSRIAIAGFQKKTAGFGNRKATKKLL